MTFIVMLFSLVAAYLLGSIPTAFIACRMMKGIDIREHGSGNVGATNVARTIGKWPGIIVLVFDFLKGTIAVTLIPLVMQSFDPGITVSYEIVYILLGAAVIGGHIWPVFLKFKGGKGVATAAGVMAGLAPLVLVVCFIIWVIIFWIWKYVSLASIIAACALPIMAVVFGKNVDFVIFCAVICMLGVYSHRANIKRLLQGKENKLLINKKVD